MHIPQIGTFQPGENGKPREYEVEAEINHPDFEEVQSDNKKGPKP